jgi:UDP-glucose 4-epimerase
MTVLVTGGAGYIGAHVVRVAREAGREVVVVDDYSTGRASRVLGIPSFRIDVTAPSSVAKLAEIMRLFQVDSVMHIAAHKQVGESVLRPGWYFRQNVTGLAHVLSAMESVGVDRLVFSSSAAVYGNPATAVVTEDAPTIPVNPYGETKLIGERLVLEAGRSWGLRGVALRYFNVAGAGWPDLGDSTVANLVTTLFAGISRGERPRVFGVDYPTPDGSCVRDFVHVMDIAAAHIKSLEYLARPERDWDVFNVGTGSGYSVLQVIDELSRVAGLDISPVMDARRPGDPATCVASVDRITTVMGWRPSAALAQILASAWHAWQAQPRPHAEPLPRFPDTVT